MSNTVDRSRLTQVSVPYTNRNVWRANRFGVYGYSTTNQFSNWLAERGLSNGGMWFDNTDLSDEHQCTLLFEDPRTAVLFKLAWGGQ